MFLLLMYVGYTRVADQEYIAYKTLIEYTIQNQFSLLLINN